MSCVGLHVSTSVYFYSNNVLEKNFKLIILTKNYNKYSNNNNNKATKKFSQNLALKAISHSIQFLVFNCSVQIY